MTRFKTLDSTEEMDSNYETGTIENIVEDGEKYNSHVPIGGSCFFNQNTKYIFDIDDILLCSDSQTTFLGGGGRNRTNECSGGTMNTSVLMQRLFQL